MNPQKKKIIILLIGILVMMNALAWIAVFCMRGGNVLEVNFFYVGQGDSALIETPQGHQILIDGGPDSSVIGKLGSEMPFWDRAIDLVILTHPEKDHVNGLLEVLKRYKVENILWTGIIRDTAEYDEWADLLMEEGAEIKIAKAGEKILAGDAEIQILYPQESIEGEILKDSNDSSIVFKLVYGENSFLFTGDAAKSAEAQMEILGGELDSDVLKVSHHGSKTSSSDAFLSLVSPEIAVISAGINNSYGHPSFDVLDRLKNYAIDILRTDELGDIKIISDGKNLKFN